MKDTIIKRNGRSNLIKAPTNLPHISPNYEALMNLLIGDGLPVDILGPLEDGCDVIGTPLDKASLLTDGTERSIWGNANNRTVDNALEQLRSLVSTAQSTANSAISTASSRAQFYCGETNVSISPFSLYFPFSPKLLVMGAGSNLNAHIAIYPWTIVMAGSASGTTIAWNGTSVTITTTRLGNIYYTAIG